MLPKNEVVHYGFLQSVSVKMVTFTEEIFNGKLHFLCSGNRTHVKDQETWRKFPVRVLYKYIVKAAH